MRKRTIAYLQLTKPKIMVLIIASGFTALVLQGSLLNQPLLIFLVLLGLYLTGGAANALNHIFEREIDSRMSRTRKRRPLPRGDLHPLEATLFAISIGAIGVAIFALVFNWLSALLSLVTIIFYSFVYTLYLKRATPQNIVIGGIAGALAPVGAWAAASGSLEWGAWTLFLIIFFWSPPHFWALALVFQKDYENTGLPMLPVVKGESQTLTQMSVYSVFLVIMSFTPILFTSNWLYLVATLLLSACFLWLVFKAWYAPSQHSFRAVFSYSIVYLFALFLFLILDKFFAHPLFIL
jgi:protoheme IX farnesyltransferase